MLLAVSHLLSLSLSLSLSHRLNRLQNLSLTIAALLDNTKPISPPHGMRGGRGRGGGEAAKYFIFWPGSNWENISLTDTQNFIESFCYPNLYEKTEEPVRWEVWLLLYYSETAIFRLQTTLQYSPCVHTSLCCSGFLCGLWGRLGGRGVAGGYNVTHLYVDFKSTYAFEELSRSNDPIEASNQSFSYTCLV